MPRTDDRARLADIAASLVGLGVRRVHSFSWRDLDDPDAGGSEVHHDRVFSRWAEHGLQIHHRSSTVLGPRELDRHGYHITQRGGRYGVFPRAVLDEVLGRAGPRDAVIEIWNGVPWLSPLWHRGPQVTWLHHVHGPMWDLELPAPLARTGRFVERRLAPPWYRRRPVVTLAEASRDELVDLGFRPDRVHVVPPGIDSRFSPGDAPRNDPPLVVSVGRLAKVKRFEQLLDAVRAARVVCGEVHLTIVGEGPERPALEAWIRNHDADGWATLAGRVADDALVDLYQRATLIASASLAEGWGMTLTEAGACGTPAVATDVVGHRGAVVNGSTGLLLPSPTELGPAIASLLADPDRLARMGTNARRRAGELSWDRAAADHLSILLGAARERS